MVEELQVEAIELQGQLENLSKISDPDLRRAALVSISQMVDSIRIRFASQGISDPERTLSKIHARIENQLTESLEKLSDNQRQRSEKARMKYQAWALGEIQTLEKMFASEGWFENNYQKKHDAAVKYLLPINQADARTAGRQVLQRSLRDDLAGHRRRRWHAIVFGSQKPPKCLNVPWIVSWRKRNNDS